MSFEIDDYSRLYYELITAIPVPSKRSGKFVIIENCDTGREYLALSATELSVYHANIVERFCVQRQINGSYNDKKDDFKIHDDAWSVNGGGMWSLDDDEKSFRLFGSSKAYGEFHDKNLKGKIASTGVMAGYTVFVNGT